MPAPSIDIAIVNYRGVADTLEALRRLAGWPHGTIWLVDNSAHETDMADESATLCQTSATMRQVVHIAPGENLGFGRACNLVFAKSNAEFFLLLNPDARIGADDIVLLANALTAQPRLGAVSPKIYWNEQRSFVLPVAFPQTPWHSVALALATRWHWLAKQAARLYLKRAMSSMNREAPFEVDFLAGAVLMLRRQAVLSAGGLFDPAYFMFFEDSDLSLRLRRAGHALAVVPTACAVHEYRHKAYKAGLMETSQLQYFGKRFPLFFRLSRKLSRVTALARPQDPAKWFRVLAQPVASAEEFTGLTDGARVLALSPSLLMMPAMTRPSRAHACCLDEKEWDLLEPAVYVALMQNNNPMSLPTWTYFERAAPFDHSPFDAISGQDKHR